jgi:translation initiation factor 1A
MPPNAKGGKGYKKKKKVTGPIEPIYIERTGDQQVARVVRLLGDRNVLCYCNDNRLRICHICGRMKGRVWIEPGDVVLISQRELVNKDSSDYNRGDVLAKYPLEHLSKLRREKGVNEKLFMKLETMDGMNLTEVGVDKTNDAKIKEADDCGFEFDRGSGSETEEDEDSSEEDAAAAGGNRIQRSRGGRQMEATQAAGGGGGDDVLDIDAI